MLSDKKTFTIQSSWIRKSFQSNSHALFFFSVVWINDVDSAEVVIAPKGRLESDIPSRLCKQRMFRQFSDIEARCPEAAKEAPVEEQEQDQQQQQQQHLSSLYAEEKRKATGYCTAKEMIRRHFKSNGLGAWVRRPLEQDLFELVE